VHIVYVHDTFLVRSCFVLCVADSMRTKGERLCVYNIVGGICVY